MLIAIQEITDNLTISIKLGIISVRKRQTKWEKAKMNGIIIDYSLINMYFSFGSRLVLNSFLRSSLFLFQVRLLLN